MVSQGALSARLAAGLGLGLAVVGCSTGAPPVAAAPDAGRADASLPEAGGGADGSGDEHAALPYPPGPYGGRVGDVLPDFTVQGYALSRAQRDSTQLPFRDIHLDELRDPSCTCLIIEWGTSGNECPPCYQEDQALSTALATDPSMCALEVVGTNFTGAGGLEPPTRADLDALTQSGRENYPVGLPTSGATAALDGDLLDAFPTSFVVTPGDMRIAGVIVGLTDLQAQARALCQSPEVVDTVATGVSPRQLAIDASDLYFSDHVAGVLRVPLGGGTPAQLARPGAAPDRVRLDARNVYWATHDGGTTFEIGQVPKSGGTPVVLTSGASGYLDIAVDTTSVYFTRADGVVGSVPIGGGPVTVIASGEPAPTSIDVDDARVYWVASGASEVASAPKSGGPRTVTCPSGQTWSLGTMAPVALAVRPTDLLVQFTRYDASQATPPSTAFRSVPKTGGAAVPGHLVLSGIASAMALDPAAKLVAARSDATTGRGAVEWFRDDNGTPWLDPGELYVSGVASDGTYVYWSTNVADPTASAGAIRRSKP